MCDYSRADGGNTFRAVEIFDAFLNSLCTILCDEKRYKQRSTFHMI